MKRAARVHEREFDTLAKTWDLMIDGYWLIAGAIHPALDWHILVECKRARLAASEYLVKNGIFLRPEIKVLFVELNRLMINLLAEHRENLSTPHKPERKLSDEYRKHGGAIMDGIERKVHERLWSSVPR